MSFFKNNNRKLLEAPNSVINKDYELKIEDKDTYTYPVNGWYYFETKDEALKFFGIKEEKPINNFVRRK